jgi:molybdopterin-guanine dinucleotide biosynthesis protein A
LAEPPPIFGLVLAGGRSRRLGRDKAAMTIDGQALLDRTVSLMRRVIDEVFVSVRADQTEDKLRGQFPMIVDSEEGLGPAAGLFAAHLHRPDVAWLVLACDLALVDESAISNLVQARNAGKAATAYRSAEDGLPEPLCAIYEPDTLARFGQQRRSGDQLSPRRLLANSDAELIELASDRALFNVNTPTDLARLQSAGELD